MSDDSCTAGGVAWMAQEGLNAYVSGLQEMAVALQVPSRAWSDAILCAAKMFSFEVCGQRPVDTCAVDTLPGNRFPEKPRRIILWYLSAQVNCQETWVPQDILPSGHLTVTGYHLLHPHYHRIHPFVYRRLRNKLPPLFYQVL
jgi:hypothetical protein